MTQQQGSVSRGMGLGFGFAFGVIAALVILAILIPVLFFGGMMLLSASAKPQAVQPAVTAADIDADLLEPPEPAPSRPVSVIVKPAEPRLTLEKFNKVEIGMSYAEVANLIGFECNEVRSGEMLGGMDALPNTAYKMLTWQNPDKSNMNATFVNGKVKSKAQAMLE